MYRILLVVTLLAVLAGSPLADDLYKVNLYGGNDAEQLKATGVEPLLWTEGGYVVMADRAAGEQLRQSSLDIELLATGIAKDELALDNRMDRKNAARFEVLYETGGLRLLHLDKTLTAAETPGELLPIKNEHLSIEYQPTFETTAAPLLLDDILDGLVSEVNQDTIYSYVCSLQTYPYRVPGSATNEGARNWIYDTFEGLGYDSVYFDHFLNLGQDCYNVVACKLGTMFPEKHIIVGGHFDAVSTSPGADDNGSGTAGVLELARLLKDIDLPVTIIFIAFDAEEVGLKGSEHYANNAYATGEEIIYMQNMDMIGAEGNSSSASLYYGAVDAYAVLWDQLAQHYSGISGVFSGTSSRSDHYPFQRAGYNVCFCIEYVFSEWYHSAKDSTTYMDFDYMRRMVMANLATVYTVAVAPPPVTITTILDPNDGQSLDVHWQTLDGLNIDDYQFSYFSIADPGTIFTHVFPSPTSNFLVEGLTDGQEYCFYVQAIDIDGYTSLSINYTYSTPNSALTAPWSITPLPRQGEIQLDWSYDGTELNFDHFSVIRDGVEIEQLTETTYVDDDPSLGSDLHEYYIMAVDQDGFASDTLGLGPSLMKAVTLQNNRVLAVNRSAVLFSDLVDGAETEAVMREALSSYDYDFIGDSTHTTDPDDTTHLDLFDMVDYELVVIGAEAALEDDIGVDPDRSGLLDSLAYYMSIGGKVVIFGRWGINNYNELRYASYLTNHVSYDDAYCNTFHIDQRASTPTGWLFYNKTYTSDMVGAHSANAEYPGLVWDSVATMAHSNACGVTVDGVGGIPYATFVELQPSVDVLYTYDSRDDLDPMEGSPVAWRYIGANYQYTYFDIPLSFFERTSAASALQQAIDDMLNSDTGVNDGDPHEVLPATYTMSQNYPNPFNPVTEIVYTLPRRSDVKLSVYNILGQHVTTLVDGDKPAGTHSVQWDGNDEQSNPVATGIYFYRLNTPEVTISKKMLLLK